MKTTNQSVLFKALLKALRSNNIDQLKKINIDQLKKIDLDATDESGNTLLMLAAQSGNSEYVNRLINAGANANARDTWKRTALMMAAENGHEACVTGLLKVNADVNARDQARKTALMRAAENGHEAVVDMLLNEGARFRRKDLKYLQNASCQVLLNQAKEARCRPLRKRLMMWSILTGVVLSVPVVVANAKALTLSAVWMSAKSIVSQVMSQGVASLPILAQVLGIGALIMTGLMIITGVISLYQLKSNRWEGVIQKIAVSLMGVVCCSSLCLVVMQFIPFVGMAEMTLTTLITSQWPMMVVLSGIGVLIGCGVHHCFLPQSKQPAVLAYSTVSNDETASAEFSIKYEASSPPSQCDDGHSSGRHVATAEVKSAV